MLIRPGMKVCNAVDPPLDSDGNPGMGTLGGVVYRFNKRLLLTCYHCVINRHLDWDNFRQDNVNDKVQTIIEGGMVTFGRIVDARRDDRVDAAVIEPFVNFDIDITIPNIGVPSRKLRTEEDVEGMSVRKYGSKTFITFGTFSGIVESVGARYPPEIPKHYFKNLLSVEPLRHKNPVFATKGDSGSFILNQQNQVLGLFAVGEPERSYLINPDFIENRLNVKFNV